MTETGSNRVLKLNYKRTFLIGFAFFGILLLPLSLYLHIPPLLKLLLNLNWLFLMATELLNSGIEAIVDLVSPEYNELAGRAKDMGSAAVLCLLFAWGITWLFAFAVHFQLFNC